MDAIVTDWTEGTGLNTDIAHPDTSLEELDRLAQLSEDVIRRARAADHLLAQLRKAIEFFEAGVGECDLRVQVTS